MTSKTSLFHIILFCALFILNNSCKKDDENPIVKDIDGNVYHTVKLGTQIWMVENLKTTKLNDGTPIKLVTDPLKWKNLTTPGYCWYNNDEVTNKPKNGALYNWYTVETGKLCPTGWHVPSDDEWKELEMYLGMTQKEVDLDYPWRGTDQGTQLKSISGWNSEGNGTDIVGFSAQPAGCMDKDGKFGYAGICAWFWTSSEQDNTPYVWDRRIYNNSPQILRGNPEKEYGLSIRCVRY